MTTRDEPKLDWDVNANGRLVILRAQTPVLVVHANDWLLEAVEKVAVRPFIAWSNFRESGRRILRVSRAVSLRADELSLLDDHDRLLATVAISPDRPGGLKVRAWAASNTVNRIGFRWWGQLSERLMGFGEYTDGPVRRGRFSTWTEEGPVGLGPLSGLLRWTGRVPLPRGHHATYAPIPVWISTLIYAGWLDNTERIDWFIQGAQRSFKAWASQFTLHLVTGDTLVDVIHARSAALGTPPDVPPWALFPWIDAVRGESSVAAVSQRLREAGIPASAIWIEDWMGSREDRRRFVMRPLTHQLDRNLYPHFESMAEQLHRDGFKVLGYLCPEIAAGTTLWQEAQSGGHLVHSPEGQPVDIVILGNHHGEPDLTKPATRQWLQERVFADAAQLGFDGWMADFGEYLPPESLLDDGTNGWTSHNRYPVLWQRLHQEFWHSKRPDGDSIFFSRSAGLGSHAITPVLWGGDSDTDWDPADGLASVIPQALSAGLAGHALWATDIAGYMTFGLTRPTTRELYMRWTEVSALLPVMRTHHGTARPRNWHWHRDEKTIRHFAQMARLHAALFPLFYHLLQEARITGLPLLRPMHVHYPDLVPELNRQFLIGNTLLAAPALKRGHTQVHAVLPEGDWVDWWRLAERLGPARVRVPAPLGRPPLWMRTGTLVPLLEGLPDARGQSRGYVDTPLSEDGRGAVQASVTLVDLGLAHPIQLHLPGGLLTVSPEPAAPDSSGAKDACAPQYLEHAPVLAVPGRRTVVPARSSVMLSALRLAWDGAHPLTVTVRVPADLGQ